MMKHAAVISVLFIVMMLLSCGEDEHRDEVVRPQLSRTSVTMTVGETVGLTVENAQQIAVTVSDGNVVSASVSGNVITLVGRAAGDVVLKINADGSWLQCRVTVVAGEYSYESELTNAVSRYVSESLSLVYGDDTPGIIFSMDDAGNIEVLSLADGSYVVFKPGTSGYSATVLDEAELSVNGIGVALAEARVERCDNTGVWLNLTSAVTGEHIVLVVTDL